MTRRERHGAILELVRTRQISTQAELVDVLQKMGVDVVQSTVSRDITDLGLVKVRGDNGHLVYAPPGTSDMDRMHALALAMQRWVMTMQASGNLVVIGTMSGYADPLAEALDEAAHPMVVGTLAGENTVFVVATEGVTGAQLLNELRSIFEETEATG